MKRRWWLFWKKEEKTQQKPQGRVLEIPEEYLERIYALADAYRNKQSPGDNLERYMLWKTIKEIFPEVGKGAWSLDTRPATILIQEETE